MKTLGDAKLNKLAEVLEEETFKKGEYIVRQGEYGETFYIIMDGEVDVTEYSHEKQSEIFKRDILAGQYFGEQALMNESGKRGANVIAKSSTVRCVTLEKKHFLRLIGDKAGINWEEASRPSFARSNKSWSESVSNRPSLTKSMPARRMHSAFKQLTLDDFEFIGILGVGGFGRVELRKLKEKPNQAFALKCMKKVTKLCKF